MLAIALLLAQQAVTLTAGDRMELRARKTFGAPMGFDAVTAPSLGLRVTSRRWDGGVSYAPLLVLRDLEQGTTPEVLHAGTIVTAWRARSARVALSETGMYGDQNGTYLVSPPLSSDGRPQPLQLLGPPRTIHFASSVTTLTTELRFSRRWSMTASIVYGLSGGLTADARTVIPLQRGPRADVSVSYTPTQLDTFTTHASVSKADFTAGPCPGGAVVPNTAAGTCSPQIEIGTVSEAWRRSLSRTSEITFGAGASVVRTRLHPRDRYALLKYPTFEVTYQQATGAEGQRSTARVSAEVAPVVDARLGAADYRAQGGVAMTIPRGRVTVRPQVAVARSLDSSALPPVTLLRGEVEVEYAPTRYLSVGAGLRYGWQKQAPLGALSTVIGLVQVTLRAPTYRF